MGIDDAVVRNLGLHLKHAPDSTVIRLPSAIGRAGGAGLGFLGVVALLCSAIVVWTAWRTPGRSIVPVLISSAIALGVWFLLRANEASWMRQLPRIENDPTPARFPVGPPQPWHGAFWPG
jgi:hypothetical protein